MKKLIINFVIITLLLVGAGMIAKIISRPIDPQVEVIFLDVGQGDATLIQKGDIQILIDGGPNKTILEKLGQKMPVGDKTIEHVILSHPHADHLDGINAVLESYEIGTIYSSGVLHTTDAYLNFLEKIQTENLKFIVPDTGQSFEPFEEATITFVWPGQKFKSEEIDNLNNSSVVNRFCYQSHCSIFTGDVESDAQNNILADDEVSLSAEIIKIPHHGSDNALVEDFVKKINPKIAIIQVGSFNPYGHPHAEVLDHLKSSGLDIYRTDEDGDIVCSLAGQWQCIGSK